MKSRAFRALLMAQAMGECGPLTNDEAAGLGLAVDLKLLTPDSDIRPGGTIRLSVIGLGLLSQLADVSVLNQLRGEWDERLSSLRSPDAGDRLRAISEDSPTDEPPAPGM